MKVVAGLKKEVKDLLNPHIQAAHGLHKALTGDRNRLLAPLENAERIIKQKMGQYQLAEEKKRREAERKAEEERQRQQEEEDAKAAEENRPAEFVAPAPPPKPMKKVEGVAMVDHYDFEITDETKIPRKYLMPNEKEIRKTVKAMKADAASAIPGIRVIRTKRPKTTGRKIGFLHVRPPRWVSDSPQRLPGGRHWRNPDANP